MVLTVPLLTAIVASLTVSVTADCHDIVSQRSLDFEQLLGTWYAVQIVEHVSPHSGQMDVSHCPRFTLSRGERDGQEERLRILWAEGSGSLEYVMTVPEDQHKGYWRSAGGQNGTLTQGGRYRQFSGAVLVTRAAADHLVLTFCGDVGGGDRQLFSVLLSRGRRMRAHYVRSINSMLERRGLHAVYTRNTCTAPLAAAAATTTDMAVGRPLLLLTALALRLVAASHC